MPSIKQIHWIDVPSIKDDRGILSSIESTINIPFEIKRIFYMHHVTADRGGHAHIDTDQVVLAISGSFKIMLFDGVERLSFQLDDPQKALFIPHMIYIELSAFSDDAVCLVLANTNYNIKKSYRNMDDYINAIKFL